VSVTIFERDDMCLGILVCGVTVSTVAMATMKIHWDTVMRLDTHTHSMLEIVACVVATMAIGGEELSGREGSFCISVGLELVLPERRTYSDANLVECSPPRNIVVVFVFRFKLPNNRKLEVIVEYPLTLRAWF